MATEVGVTELANDTELEVVEITTGLQLVPGPKGDTGDTGPAGPAGPQGEQGPAGPTGPKGDTGPQGVEGPRGAQGLTGPIGATGATGPKGDTGAAGPKGDTGSQGPAGATGATGPKGDTGATGVAGPKGDKGDKGDTGPAGSAGMPGEPGLNGESVANVYIETDGTLVVEMTNGATFEAGNLASDILAILPAGGTTGQILAKIDDEDFHSEWIDAPEGTGGGSGTPGEDGVGIASAIVNGSGHLIITLTDSTVIDAGLVKGADGATGTAGAKGDKGDTGTAGATGSKGDKGDTGAQGATGPGVPSGGSAGQVLRKIDATDYNTQWATPAAGTVTTLSVTTANGVSGTVANATSTPAISLTLGAITPTSVAATGTVTGTNIVQGFVLSCCGKPAANEIVVVAEAPYAFTATATNCTAKSVTAATASTVFTIKKGTTTVGTFTFAAGATTATKSITSGAIAKGDLVTITAPATADATLSDISFTVRA